jgi:phytoene dehydrogenase-like protein
MGYLTFYLGLKCKLPEVNHHNYYLGNNFEEYSRNVMKNPDTTEKPYYYVNVLSKNNPDCAPEGCESLFFVCPVPTCTLRINGTTGMILLIVSYQIFLKDTGRILPVKLFRKLFYPGGVG